MCNLSSGHGSGGLYCQRCPSCMGKRKRTRKSLSIYRERIWNGTGEEVVCDESEKSGGEKKIE